MDHGELPEGAKVTDDLDCVVLSSPPSFFSQIVRLAVVEKGVKYKFFTVNHTKFEHMRPWYIKANPRCYVPTLLVAGNKPVCESMDIVLYLDKNFRGTRQLDGEISASPEAKERFDAFMKKYDSVMVEPFSFGTLSATPLGPFFPLVWLLSLKPIYGHINSGKNSPEVVQLYKNKLVSKAEQAREWVLQQPASLDEASRRMAELLAAVESWMSEHKSEWALGTREYTTADVFLTVLLHRIRLNKAFLAAEVLSRPCLAKYLDKVIHRETSAIANVNSIPLPPNAAIRVGMGLVVGALNVVFYLGLRLAGVQVGQNNNAWKYFGGFSVAVCAAATAVNWVSRRVLATWADGVLDRAKRGQ